jgi:hypothetical protein
MSNKNRDKAERGHRDLKRLMPTDLLEVDPPYPGNHDFVSVEFDLTSVRYRRRDGGLETIPVVDPSKVPLPTENGDELDINPSPAAERLLSLFTPPERLDETLGDFEEKFRYLAKRHSVRHAHRWYWWQIIAVALRGGLKAALQAAKIWFGPA